MSEALRVLIAKGNHGQAVAEDKAGRPTGAPVDIRFRRSVGRPLPGDLVTADAHGGVTGIEPRRTLFGRGDRGRFRPIAANLDTLLIVLAPEPAPSPSLLHRYVTAARLQSVQPAVVVNKSDLGIPDTAPFDEIADLDVPVFHTRAEGAASLDGLDEFLASGIHLLAGQSGVGKSSLANVLVPDLSLQTERLSKTTGKGRHTTTATRLFAMPSGGWLVDTPGVWEYSLWRMEPRELATGFPELADAAAACRFRDCRHESEPACAVRVAVESGQVPASRYRAWLALLDEQRRLAAD